MVTFALFSQYVHKVLCYRKGQGEESQWDCQKCCFSVVTFVLTWLTTLQVRKTIPYSQRLRHKKQAYMNQNMAEFWLSQIFIEVSRIFPWYKWWHVKVQPLRIFLLITFSEWKMEEFFLNYTMLCLFLMPVALSGDPDLPNTACLNIPQFWKPSSMQPGVLPAALQQPVVFCRTGLCPCKNRSNPV